MASATSHEAGGTMKSHDVWQNIHDERREMVRTWSGLSPEQWGSDSLCSGWTVQQVAGHIVAAAEQTPLNFYKDLARAGFKFNVFTERDATRNGAAGPAELIRRLEARTTTTNHPPAPVIAMLGEIVVHGADIRRPLGLSHRPSDEALVAVADNWKKTNLLIGSKRRIEGVRLRATDVDWSHGEGPDVNGPMLSLLLAMSGRKIFLNDLSGEGVPTLDARP
jgi:uncharacterized protein (TIGR03083 family)